MRITSGNSNTDGSGQAVAATRKAIGGGSHRRSISLVIPTMNEAGNIEELVTRIERAGAGTIREVVFVDDSTDGTPEVISGIARRSQLPVSLIHRPPDRRGDGLGGAVAEGIRAATGDWVCVMDADLQHPPELIPSLLECARHTGAEIVVASRYAHSEGAISLDSARLVASRLCTIAARILFPRRLRSLTDPLSGYFLVRREVVDPDGLRPRGFKILLEILLRSPHLRVAEIPFRFQRRHAGQSKAGLREGVRYLTSLLDLRFQGLRRLTRFGLVGASGLVVNQLLLLTFAYFGGIHYLLSAALATLGSSLWNFSVIEAWVFTDRLDGRSRRQRLARFLLMNTGALLLRAPFLVIMTSGLGLHYLLSNLTTLLALTLARYTLSDRWIWAHPVPKAQEGVSGWRATLSESWIWTESASKARDVWFNYDIHGIMRVASEVRLPELGFFRTSHLLEGPDVRIRIAHSTSSGQVARDAPRDNHQEFRYREVLGPLGFWVNIARGEFTDVVASPLLRWSPHVLYTNVLEPIVRWMLVQKGYALVHGACVAIDGRAVLVTGPTDTGKTTTILRLLAHHPFTFLSDDMTILRRDGRGFCYPKPLTISRHTLEAVDGQILSGWQRLALRVQSRVHSKTGRRTALALARMPLPMATINAIIQVLVPPPKYLIQQLIPNTEIGREATVSQVVAIDRGPDAEVCLDGIRARETVFRNCEDAYGFPPYAALERFLAVWNGQDLRSAEHEIISEALSDCVSTLICRQKRTWWERLPALLNGADAEVDTLGTASGPAEPSYRPQQLTP